MKKHKSGTFHKISMTVVSCSLAATASFATISPAYAEDADNLLTDMGHTLSDAGIYLQGSYVGQFAAAADGGLHPHSTAYEDQIYVGANFDMKKIAGINGGLFDVDFVNRDGTELPTGNAINVQNIGFNTYMLTEFAWDQKLGDSFEAKFGRLSVDDYFDVDPTVCNGTFMNDGMCGQPGIMLRDTDATWWPLPSWGAWAKQKFGDFALQVGVYQAFPDAAYKVINNHGVWFGDHGGTSDGVWLPVQLTYDTTGSNDPYPVRFMIGDVHGPSSGVSRTGATLMHEGENYLYVLGKINVTRPDLSADRGLWLFATAETASDASTEPEDYSYQIGAVQQGTWASRPGDSINFVVDAEHLSKNEVNLIDTTRLAQPVSMGAYQPMSASNYMMELSYKAVITPWMNLLPNVQYVINPDGNGGNNRGNIPNAFVVGLQFSVDFPGIMGIPNQ